jgi:hypothetical protein
MNLKSLTTGIFCLLCFSVLTGCQGSANDDSGEESSSVINYLTSLVGTWVMIEQNGNSNLSSVTSLSISSSKTLLFRVVDLNGNFVRSYTAEMTNITSSSWDISITNCSKASGGTCYPQVGSDYTDYYTLIAGRLTVDSDGLISVFEKQSSSDNQNDDPTLTLMIDSGTLAEYSLSTTNPSINVSPAGSITGSITLATNNELNSSSVVPLCGSPNWGTPASNYWTISSWIETGNQTQTASVTLTAPSIVGTYYILFAANGSYDCSQIMSGTHPAYSADWANGNVLANLPSSQLDTANENAGYISGYSWYTPSGNTDPDNLALTAIKVIVSSTDAEDDHANSTGAATTIATNSTTSGNLESEGDEDFFKVNISSSGTLSVSTTGSTDTYGYLLNSSGNTLIEDDDSGESVNFSLSYSVTPGTYYIRVKGFNSSTIGSYSLVTSLSTSGSSSIAIISPNGNENLVQGSTYSITWNSTGDIGTNVKIELYDFSSFKSTIISSTANDGNYNWTIPSDLTVGSNYKVKISSISNPSFYDYSDANFSISSSSSTNSVVLYPTKDATVNQDSPNINYGDGDWLLVGRDYSGYYHKSFLAFDLSSIPTGSTINSAFLVFGGNSEGSFELIIKSVAQSWSEETITWNNTPITHTFPFIQVTPPADYTKTFDVNEIVKLWVSNSRQNYGFILSISASAITAGNYIEFVSSNHFIKSRHPTLEINYTH